MNDDIKDFKNIRLTVSASNAVDKLMEMGLFQDALTVCKFAFAYALHAHFSEITPDVLEQEYSKTENGHQYNYNIGSFDEDNFMSNVILSVYPQTETPYRYIRVITIWGLNKLVDIFESNPTQHLSDLM